MSSDKVSIPCKKCNEETSFIIDEANKFNKENRYVCKNCIVEHKMPTTIVTTNDGSEVTRVEKQFIEVPCSHGHMDKSKCPLCGYIQHKQQWTLNFLELVILGMIVCIVIIVVSAIVLLNPLGPKQPDTITITATNPPSNDHSANIIVTSGGSYSITEQTNKIDCKQLSSYITEMIKKGNSVDAVDSAIKLYNTSKC